MLNKLRRLIAGEAGPNEASGGEDDLQLATAALLVRVGTIDDEFDAGEQLKLKRLLQNHFALSQDDAAGLMRRARDSEAEATDLYRFTSVITKTLDRDGRRRIVEMMWEMVFADGTVDEFEANLVWRVAELIGIGTRERVELRKQVEARRASQ